METWLKIHTYLVESSFLLGVLTLILTHFLMELAKRFFPTWSEKSIAELVGKILNALFDALKIPNRVKREDGQGNVYTVEMNPKKKVEAPAKPDIEVK